LQNTFYPKEIGDVAVENDLNEFGLAMVDF